MRGVLILLTSYQKVITVTASQAGCACYVRTLFFVRVRIMEPLEWRDTSKRMALSAVKLTMKTGRNRGLNLDAHPYYRLKLSTIQPPNAGWMQ